MYSLRVPLYKFLVVLLLSFGLTACNPLSIFHKDTKEPTKVLKEVVVKPTTINTLKVPKASKVHKAPKVHKVPKKKAAARHFTQKEIIRDCKADFYKTNCVAHMPNRKAVEACMRAKKEQLAPLCRRHL